MSSLQKFMKTIYLFSLLLVLAQTNDFTLKQVYDYVVDLQVFVHTRHGARAPMYNVLDSYNDYWLKNYGVCELTSVGHRQHYLLGRELNKWYHGFLPNFYDEDLVDIFSTQSQRAIRSAQALIMGVFPESDQTKPKELEDLTLSFPPGFNLSDFESVLRSLGNKRLPYGHQTIAERTTFNPERDCSRVNAIVDQAMHSSKYYDFEKHLWDTGFYKRFVAVFTNELVKLGISTDTTTYNSDLNMILVGKFYDSIVCDIFGSIPLPAGLSKQLIKEMLFVYDVQNLWRNFPNLEAVNLKGSSQTRDILKYIEQLKNQQIKTKFIVISGHDGDVNNMLQFLGLQSPTFDFADHENNPNHTNAPFASSLIIEVYGNLLGEYYIQTKFNGKLASLPFCQVQTQCTLSEFSDHVIRNSYSEADWTRMCNTPLGDEE